MALKDRYTVCNTLVAFKLHTLRAMFFSSAMIPFLSTSLMHAQRLSNPES